jgi:deoxyribonuclease-4
MRYRGISTCVRIGIHTSISGSLERAALKAAELGANTFQIFSSSPRRWRPSVLDPAAVGLLRNAREKHDLYPLVIHDNYLINLASCTEELRRKSVEAFRGEIERAVAIGAEYLVAHPGSCRGFTREEGITAVVRSLVEAADGVDTRSLTVLLENTAGSGESLGSKPEDLEAIREYTAHFSELRIAYCVDTCHAFVAGSDAIAFAARLGYENVPVIHANDSRGAHGSHTRPARQHRRRLYWKYRVAPNSEPSETPHQSLHP